MIITKKPFLSSDLYRHFSKEADYSFWELESINEFLKLEHNSLWIQYIDQKPAGMLIWSNKVDQIELIYIFIKQSLRRSDLAFKLFHQSLSKKNLENKQKPSAVFLEVRKDNLKAIKLYKKIGFTLSRQRSHYYSDGCDALEMILTTIP